MMNNLMRSSNWTSKIAALPFVFLFCTGGCGGSGGGNSNLPNSTVNAFYSTKTPYEPQQSASVYETAPAGYTAVFTEMLARHGSRALTSDTDIQYLKQLIAFAKAASAFTPLGATLEPQVTSLEAANLSIGYGNLSGRGMIEHQQLAARLLERLPDLFAGATSKARHVEVVTSGKDRAVDSGKNFVDSLASHSPDLAPLIDPPVVNTHLLYFFKENEAYLDWLANNRARKDKLSEIFYSDRSHREARRMLVRLFRPGFVDKLASGQLQFKHPKTGDPVTLNEVDLAVSLYDLYQVAPGLSAEGTWDFDRYVLADQAQWFAYVKDSGEFYEKGPSFAGESITFAMAQFLQDDFFGVVEANCRPDAPLVADLRFAHAETVMPLAALMKLPGSDQQVPAAKTYTYANNPWRGDQVSPYAVNIQWDAFANNSGRCLIRMLYNEKQTRFKSSCSSIRPKSFFYDLTELKRCYGE
jgi:hypothetical protein